jgi:hypothetical protein
MTTANETTTRIRTPDLRYERVTTSGIDDEWSSAFDLYLFKYAEPVPILTNSLDVGDLISFWLQADTTVHYVDDLAVILRDPSETVEFAEPSGREFVLSYLRRTYVNNEANRSLLDVSNPNFGEFDALSNLRDILARPVESPMSRDIIDAAEAALSRQRARVGQSAAEWARLLSADLATHKD